MSQEQSQYDPQDMSRLQEQGWASMRQLLDEYLPPEEGKRRVIFPVFWRGMAAAVVLLLGSLAWLRYYNRQQDIQPGAELAGVHEPQPKKTQAAGSQTATKSISENNNPAVDAPIIDNTTGLQTKKSNGLTPKAKSRDGQNNFPGTTTGTAFAKGTETAKKSLGVAMDRDALWARAHLPINKRKADNSGYYPSRSTAKIAASNGQRNVPKIEALAALKTVAPNNSKLAGKRNSNILPVENDAPDKIILAKKTGQPAKDMETNKQKPFQWTDPYKDSYDSAKVVVIAKNNNALHDSAKATVTPENAEWALTDLQKKKIAELDEAIAKNYSLPGNDKIFDMAVLLNRNLSKSIATGNSLYDIPVYPTVTASIRLSQKMGLTTGITANAPSEVFGSSASELSMSPTSLTASDRSPSLTSDRPESKYATSSFAAAGSGSLVVRQAFYWQVPVLLDFWPVKHFKLSAGTNLAFAQKVLVEQGIGDNASVQLMNYSSLQGNGMQGNNIRMFDPRMNFGGQYQWRRTLIGLHFSRSVLSSTRQVDGVDQNYFNQMVNFTFGFKLFK